VPEPQYDGRLKRMKKEIAVMKDVDWSVNLEDPYYEEHPDEMLAECIDAIQRTKEGRYVNLVTPGACGDPREWLIARLSDLVREANVPVREIRYIDQCGCGGYVTRVLK